MKWVAPVVLLLVLLPSSLLSSSYPFASIQPVQVINDDGRLVNACTAFSINERRGLWVTADHCHSDLAQIEGKLLKFVFHDEKVDVAVFEGRKVKSLKAATSVRVGDQVTLIGYPHGALDPILFFGRVASPLARLTPSLSATIFDLLGLPGDSGAPILNEEGKVVGIGQQSTKAGASYGEPLSVLKETLKDYWEK